MEIVRIRLEEWNTIGLSLNWAVLFAAIIAFILLSILLRKLSGRFLKKSISINEVKLGIGSSSISIYYYPKDREIAYKLWVELSTRKIGIPFDDKNDVIVEVYNSWYGFFKIARELMKELPATYIKKSNALIDLTEKVLNIGMRPHLTTWQAKFRKWYEVQNRDATDKSPQEIQQKYPEYEALISDLKATNWAMIEFKELMYKIAFDK